MNALIVSFPKSGRTWLICLIAQFLANGTCAQSASDGYLKTHGIWYNHGEFMFNRGQHPYKGRAGSIVPKRASSFFRRHACLADTAWIRPNSSATGAATAAVVQRTSAKLIVLERDVRDVVVSSYFERVYRGHIWHYQYKGNISSYLREQWGGFSTLLAFRKATFDAVHPIENGGPACPTARSRIVRLQYERLTACPVCVLRELCDFLFWRPGPAQPEAAMCDDDARLQFAVQRCNFSTLKAHAAGNGKWGEAIRGNKDSSKIREGKVGGFKSSLSPADRAYLDEQIQNQSLRILLSS